MLLFTEMSTSDFLLAYAFIGFVTLIFLGITIAAAVGVGKRNRLLVAQIKLLREIALKQDVPTEKVFAILKETQIDVLKPNE